MGKKSATIITLTVLLLALATPCVWLGLVNRQKRLDKALFEAAEHGTGEDVRKAVEAGGRVNAREEDLEPVYLPLPMLEDHATLSDFFLACGIHIASYRPHSYGFDFQPLHEAAKNNNLAAIQVLIAHGSAVDAANNEGLQPIHLAAQEGHIQAISCLIEAGAQATAMNHNGYQPLHEAAQFQRIEAAKCLIDHGAKPDAKDNDGYQPLHCAVGWDTQNPQPMIEFLIAAGAKASAKTIHGKIPADMAKEGAETPEIQSNYLAAAAYLEAQAAKEQSP